MSDDDDASDEALMIAYRDGDAGAFERLYRRHRGGLFRFLLRQCGGAAVAEELFQDVWMNLIRARQRYVPQARFATYLYHVAHNRLIDHFRRNVHRPSAPEREDDEVDPVELIAADPREAPEAQLQTKARIERFSYLLSELPSVQREAFVMHEEGGLSIEEIAQATGVNPETAKSRLRYAVAKLRRGLLELM
jgi:RNA polymerase sigma-70 factor (ECF subfamily)